MKHPRPVVVASLLGLALAAAAVAGVVAHASSSTANATTIRVTEREFSIGLTPKKVTAGRVTFVVHNAGRLTHALALAGPGVAKKRTPLLRPGTSAKLTVTLKAGTYSLWCPVPGHAADGMKTSLTVHAGVPSSGGSSGGGGGGGSSGGGSGGGSAGWG